MEWKWARPMPDGKVIQISLPEGEDPYQAAAAFDRMVEERFGRDAERNQETPSGDKAFSEESVHWETVDIQPEPPPSGHLTAAVALGVGFIGGAGLWAFGFQQLAWSDLTWSHLGLLAAFFVILIGLERTIYGFELIVQTLILQRRSQRYIDEIRELLGR
jgi:hypothetical protein